MKSTNYENSGGIYSEVHAELMTCVTQSADCSCKLENVEICILMSKFPIVLERNCEQTRKLSWPNFTKVLVKWATFFSGKSPICSLKWAEIFLSLLTTREAESCKVQRRYKCWKCWFEKRARDRNVSTSASKTWLLFLATFFTQCLTFDLKHKYF